MILKNLSRRWIIKFVVVSLLAAIGFNGWYIYQVTEEKDMAEIEVQRQLVEANHNFGRLMRMKADNAFTKKDFNTANLYFKKAFINLKPKSSESKSSFIKSFTERHQDIIYTTPTLSLHNGSISDIHYSPNGKQIASAASDGVIKLWDTKTGQLLHTLQGHSSGIHTIKYSHNGKQLVSISRRNIIELWNINTGSLVKTIDTDYKMAIHNISYSPDDKNILLIDDSSIRIWRVDTGEIIKQFDMEVKSGTNIRKSFKFHPDRSLVSYISGDNTVLLFDINTGKTIKKITWDNNTLIKQANDNPQESDYYYYSDYILDIGYVHKNEQLIIISNDYIRYFSLDDKKIVKKIKNLSGVKSDDLFNKKIMGYNKNYTHTLIYKPSDENSLIINILTGEKSETSLLSIKNIVFNDSNVFDGILIKTDYYGEGYIDFIDIIQSKHYRKKKVISDYKNQIKTITGFPPESRKTIDITSDEITKEIELVHSLFTYSPNGKFISIKNKEGIKIFNLETMKLEKILKGDYSYFGIKILKYSPDGENIIIRKSDDSFDLWNIPKSMLTKNIKSNKEFDRVENVTYSNNSKFLMASAGESFSIWTLLGEKIKDIDGQLGIFSPDSQVVAFYNSDSIKLWNIDEDKISDYPFKKGVSVIRSSPNSKLFYFSDRTYIYAINKKGVLDFKLKHFLGSVDNIDFSENGKMLIVSNGSETNIFDVSSRFDFDGVIKNNSFISSVNGKYIVQLNNKIIDVIDILTAKIIKKIPIKIEEYNTGNVKSIIYASSKKIISRKMDSIQLWNIEKEDYIEIPVSGDINKVAYDAKKNQISFIVKAGGVGGLFGSIPAYLTMLNLNSQKENSIEGQFSSIDYSVDGNYLASLSSDYMTIFDTKDGHIVSSTRRLPENLNFMDSSIKYRFDSNQLIYTDGENIKILDIKDGSIKKHHNIFDAHSDDIDSLSYGYNGKQIMSITEDTCKIWDVDTLTLAFKFDQLSCRYVLDGKKLFLYKQGNSMLLSMNNINKLKSNSKLSIQKDLEATENYFGIHYASLYENTETPPLWPKHHIEHWLLKAQKGNANAMYQIALIHDRDNNNYRGESAKFSKNDDNLQALKWYQKSLCAGSKKAQERIDFLRKWMKDNGYYLEKEKECIS